MSAGEHEVAGQRVVVVGTTAGVRGACAAIRAGVGEGEAEVVGAVVVGDRRTIEGAEIDVEVVGDESDVRRVVEEAGATTAVVCVPRAMGEVGSRVAEELRGMGLAVRVMATAGDVVAGRAGSGDALRELGGMGLAGLIGRGARRLDRRLARNVVEGKRVMITGAGGSIGAELARLCAQLGPAKLILMDRSDNALFGIDREIGSSAREVGGVDRVGVLHDVVDAEGTLRRMRELRPHVVFHAAAHKHVPMMEDHPVEAVRNNLFGTKSVADGARETGVERFVMISTDKAVEPANVMGATKLMAEWYVRTLGERSGRGDGFRLVRFGNVLGSACSVLPIWAGQLARGEAVTVTDARMTRYFMTIPEAASLVVQAAGLHGVEVAVLDMGEPIRVVELAERFVRASGLEPVMDGDEAARDAHGRDAARIVFTGARPGEKLHERLAHEAEELRATAVDGVMAWTGGLPGRDEVERMVGEMESVCAGREAGAAMETIRRWVPTVGGGGAGVRSVGARSAAGGAVGGAVGGAA